MKKKENIFSTIVNTLLKDIDVIEDDEKELYHASKKYLAKYGEINTTDTFFMYDMVVKKIKRNILAENKITNDEIKEIIINYDFIENIIAEIIKEVEGSACSVDKARSVVSNYIKTLKKEEVKLNNSEWWNPKKGNLENWNNLCSSIVNLTHGFSENFVKERKNIMNLYRGEE